MSVLSKLPQKLSSPFALLGDEAKLAFRSQPSGISKLASNRNIGERDAYWDQYTVLFDSASDVFSLISPQDNSFVLITSKVRRALIEAPENVATLIRVITSRLFNLVSDHTFPSAPTTYVTSFASSLIKGGATDRNTTKEVLNCIRVLQRVFPVIFELESEPSVFEKEVLWKKDVIEGQNHSEQMEQTPQFIIEDEDEDVESGTPPASPLPQIPPKQTTTHPSLAERLFSCLIDLLFCCGFTLPPKLQVDHYKINYIIWEKGVGSTAGLGPAQAYDANKTEVLRLLLVLLSRQVYSPPSSLFTTPSLYTLHFVQHTQRRDVLTILCSLLNTTMNSSQPSNATVISGVAGRLPYNHLVFKGEDSRANLVSVCFQVLCALLDFQSGSARDTPTSSSELQTYAPALKTNAFRYFLAKVHRTGDFAFIVDGILGILEQQMASINNMLPGSRRSVPYIVDTIILFWKMIELNKKFRAYLLEQEKSMDILAYLLCLFLETKDKPEQHGLCRALSYIIQTLSAEHAFGLRLTFPIRSSHIPTKWNVGGATADFMINAVYFIIATTSGSLSSMYPALIIALSNSAPYYKNLNVNSATRLLQLFSSFANPAFLLADEGHPRLLFFMVEVFNSIIARHPSENPNLIYALLRAHRTFEDLGTFTLARGLRDVRRIQRAKEDQTHTANTKGKSRAAEEEYDQAHEEKQRMLERENALGISSREQSADSLTEVRVVPRDSPLQEPAGNAEDTPSLQLPMSPSIEQTLSGIPTAVSEKARGKMREQRSMSLDTENSLDRVTATAVGRNGFVPTQEWVTSWQQGLPLDPVMLIISELMPKIQEFQASHKPNPTNAILDYLGHISLKHILPTPPPLNPRRFIWSESSIVWLSSLTWGEIYVRSMTPLGIWNSTSVRLFYVKHVQNNQRQLTEAVSSVVGGLLGRGGTESSQQPLR
ncbi:high-temperature-induced dauer-formation protein-domain-containing protein [Multifurca ochricompacta]|uniref:High-temperature-induced dauer-formation protein-domain-containing protein n=1 Tax=Multifurca ochricompacta TaxID=376703 RepID=A0AAD4M6E8_9AGAM|nr:high-temperature-induced dauer-formation protein-domain-containing protein [Multifurca ochricompacta]